MSIAWLNTAAFAGLALVALPIAIHLLVRQQSRTYEFPSLRFLRATSLAAFRRRTIQDAVLLLCRVAIVTAAALALAGPVLQMPSRTAAYAGRVARAIVVVDSGAGGSAAGAGDAFRSARFERADVKDAIEDARRWLEAQPPASREIVFTGAFRRGSIDRADMDAIPDTVGVRFVAADADEAPAEVRLPMLLRRNDSLARVERLVRFGADDTEVIDGAGIPVPADRIRILARRADRDLAEAALAAALTAGVRWTTSDRKVLIVWDGADESVVASQSANAEVVRMPVPDPPASAASAVAAALDAATPRLAVEPLLISRERLTEWSRRPGPPPAHAPPADEGDRRWPWALALAFLGAEQWLRRSREPGPAMTEQESRVA